MPIDLEIPTVNGTRPQAILNPTGNKGADLIETIRLERLQASIRNEPARYDPPPARDLFVPAHHTLQAPPRRVRPNTAAAAAQGAVAVASAMGLQLLCSDSAHGARQTLHAGVVLCACRFSTDGAQLAAAAMDGRVFVRRRADGGWSQPPPLL